MARQLHRARSQGMCYSESILELPRSGLPASLVIVVLVIVVLGRGLQQQGGVCKAAKAQAEAALQHRAQLRTCLQAGDHGGVPGRRRRQGRTNQQPAHGAGRHRGTSAGPTQSQKHVKGQGCALELCTICQSRSTCLRAPADALPAQPQASTWPTTRTGHKRGAWARPRARVRPQAARPHTCCLRCPLGVQSCGTEQ